MKLLRYSIRILLLLTLIAGLWWLANLPQISSVVSLRAAGWKLDMTLGGMLLALAAGAAFLFAFRAMLKRAVAAGNWLRRRKEHRRRMAWIGNVFTGDWQQLEGLEFSSDDALDETAYRLLQAMQLLKTGAAEQAASSLEPLEKVAEIAPAARLLRAKALRSLGQSEQALQLLHKQRKPPDSPPWLLLQLELLQDLGRWPELSQQLQKPHLDALPADRLASLRYQTWLHLLQDAQTPDAVLKVWQEAKSIAEPDEAKWLLEVAFGKMNQLHHPDQAAAVLLQELTGDFADKALSLCLHLSPGAHCLPLLQEIVRLRKQRSSRPLRAAQAWLLLCCGDSADEAAKAGQTPKKLLADWGQDSAG